MGLRPEAYYSHICHKHAPCPCHRTIPLCPCHYCPRYGGSGLLFLPASCLSPTSTLHTYPLQTHPHSHPQIHTCTHRETHTQTLPTHTCQSQNNSFPTGLRCQRKSFYFRTCTKGRVGCTPHLRTQEKEWVWVSGNTWDQGDRASRGDVPIVVELCPPRRHVQVLTLVPVNVTVPGKRVFIDVIR